MLGGKEVGGNKDENIEGDLGELFKAWRDPRRRVTMPEDEIVWSCGVGGCFGLDAAADVAHGWLVKVDEHVLHLNSEGGRLVVPCKVHEHVHHLDDTSMHAKAKRREASARKEDDRTYEALRAELWEADDSRATGKAYWRSNRVFREQSNRVFREQAGNVREVVVNQDGTWQGEEDRIACQGLSPDLSFNPKRRLLPKACASANSEGREAAVIPESRGLSVSWIHIHVPRFTQPRHHAVFLAVSGCPRELDLETSKSEHDHIVPLYDGPVPCYGATLDAPDFATVILAKFARTDRDCISPAHRAQKAVFMEMDELPPVLYDRQLFCYTRFCFSQDELDRLSTFRPWYLAAELEGRLWRFGHAFKHEWNENIASISENEAEALLFRLKFNLFATAQRTESSPHGCFFLLIVRISALIEMGSGSGLRDTMISGASGPCDAKSLTHMPYCQRWDSGSLPWIVAMIEWRIYAMNVLYVNLKAGNRVELECTPGCDQVSGHTPDVTLPPMLMLYQAGSSFIVTRDTSYCELRAGLWSGANMRTIGVFV
ncbi:hypothetical protein BDZ89DRAFT_1234041 [Hymenopellis radicata]|nr:hypothetical protein BDZ89DRAFT_1234041 [Hymenopellis radicata]